MKILLLSLFLILPNLVSAQVYKWVDEQGNVHYGQKPAGAGAKKLSAQGQGISVVEDENTDRNARKEYLEERRVKREQEKLEKLEKQKKAKEKKKLAKTCAQAKKNYQVLKRGGRIYTETKKGEHNYMSEAQVKKRLKREKAMIKKYCK